MITELALAVVTSTATLDPTAAELYHRLIDVTAYAAEQQRRRETAERQAAREREARRACEAREAPPPEWIWPVFGGSVGLAVAAAIVIAVEASE